MRLITLSDGTCMSDSLIVFETDAPIEELKELERLCCQIYKDGGDLEDILLWADVLYQKGYKFDYVADHPHVNPYDTSSGWLEKNYPNIQEHYIIENQPNLK